MCGGLVPQDTVVTDAVVTVRQQEAQPASVGLGPLAAVDLQRAREDPEYRDWARRKGLL